MKSIREDLAEHGVLVADGAWGSQLYAAGLRVGDCPEAWNIERADTVRGIATAYAGAGAQIISTNSFGGNRIRLAHHGLADEARALNEAAATLSREAAGARHIAASIGPSGKFLHKGEVAEAALYDAFAEQALALEHGGADACHIETMATLEEAGTALRAVKENTALEVIVSFTFRASPDGYDSLTGVTPEEMAVAMCEAGADIIGCNCTLDPAGMIGVVAALHAAAPDAAIFAQPNAGQPIPCGNGFSYPVSPEDFAACVPRLLAAGARIIGGCCGTTPAHIRAIRGVLE